jgi:UDP-glucose:(heptosyl)LPS alpha-1,3-glucosyltransferase
MVARDYRSVHHVPNEHIKIIYNGVDTEKFAPFRHRHQRDAVRRGLGIADDQLVLMLVAHDHQLKGLPTLIQVAGQLVDQGQKIHLLVVGGRASRSQLAEIGRLQLGGRVHFVGRVGDPVPFYQAADIYVHPTRYDACSLSVLEALAVGLPVITTRCNGAAELVEDGVSGYVVDRDNCVPQICRHVRGLLSAAARQSMGTAARHAAERLTLEENFRRIHDLYQEVLEKKQRFASRRYVGPRTVPCWSVPRDSWRPAA